MSAVDDDKNADSAIDITLRTPIPPALTGRLACLHCSFVMLTFIMLLRTRRRLLSMSDSNVWPAHLMNSWLIYMNLDALHEARRSTSASWAEMRCKRTNALFRSRSLILPKSWVHCRTWYMKGSPSSVALFMVQWRNWPIGTDVKALGLFSCSHLMKFKLSPIVPSF